MYEHSTSGGFDEGLKRARGLYRGRATDSGKRGDPHSIPAITRPQARPQMIDNMRDGLVPQGPGAVERGSVAGGLEVADALVAPRGGIF